MKERLARWLKSRGLALNETKTRVLQSCESGFKFLGFPSAGSNRKKERRTCIPKRALRQSRRCGNGCANL